MSVKMMAATPASSKRRARSTRSGPRSRPSPRSRPCRRARRRRRRSARESAPRRLTNSGSLTAAVPRITRARRARSSASRSPGADAAAELHLASSTASRIRLDRVGIHRPARERAVEIDDVEPFEPCLVEARGPAPAGLSVKHRRARHVALLAGARDAVLQIDGGKQDHGASTPGKRDERSPARWLFSGWNCAPTTLSRATAAVIPPPWSACAATIRVIRGTR